MSPISGGLNGYMEMARFWDMLIRPKHQRIKDNLSAYIDGELSSRQAAQIERHIEECGECRRQLDSLRQTVHLLKQIPALPVPRSFLLPASATEGRREFKARTRVYHALQGATALAALLLAFVVAGDFLLLRDLSTAPIVMTAPSPMAAAPEMAVEAIQETPGEPAEKAIAQRPTMRAPAEAPAVRAGMPDTSKEDKPLRTAPAQAAGQTPAVVLPEVAKGFSTEQTAVVISAAPTSEPRAGALSAVEPTVTPPETTTFAELPGRVWQVEIAVGLFVIMLLVAMLVSHRRLKRV